jgi:hypothetical protein
MQSGREIPDFVEGGYVLAYAADAADFPVNVMAVLSGICFLLFVVTGYAPLLAPAFATGCTAYYHYPLREKTPRIGAWQYGVFIDGLGLIPWRVIADIKCVTFTSRFAQAHEMQIHLKAPIEKALYADWRRLPLWRLLMKLPWVLKDDTVVRISLKSFDVPGPEICSRFRTMWEYYR